MQTQAQLSLLDLPTSRPRESAEGARNAREASESERRSRETSDVSTKSGKTGNGLLESLLSLRAR